MESFLVWKVDFESKFWRETTTNDHVRLRNALYDHTTNVFVDFQRKYDKQTKTFQFIQC